MAGDKDKNNEGASIVRFSKVILGWNFLRLVKESKEKEKKEKDAGPDSNKDKNAFKDVDDYLGTFEPLLFEEVKAHITQKKDDEEAPEWKMRLVMECSEADGFHFPAVTHLAGDEEQVSQNDLLLLSERELKVGSKPTQKYAFALVENKDRHNNLLRLRMYLGGEFMKVYPDVEEKKSRLADMQRLITSADKKPLFSLKLCSLSTIAREYIALRSIGSLPFKDLILTASDNKSGSKDQAWQICSSLHDYFNDHLNKSQKEAIYAGLSRNKFVLIQGPPGTGKTQTILALLSAILHATPAIIQSKVTEIIHRPQMSIEEKNYHWHKASPWLFGTNPRDLIMPIDGDDGFFPTTGNELKPEVVLSSRKYRVRVLVCAPSNSALDEIVFRLIKTGVRDENGSTYMPKIVRIGLKPHHSVETVSLDYLVNQRQHLAGDKQKQGAMGGDLDSVRATVLDEAVIVFSTLSFSGSAVLTKLKSGFDVVIIDEAAQAVEPATLVPLATGCKQVFLIGDPDQLPATVISTKAGEKGYGKSLFERFEKAGYPVHMLTTQYRMHPEIRTFPSNEFYKSKLEDGSDVELQTMRDWHKFRCFGPFCFLDIHEGKESRPSGTVGSLVNEDEIEFALLMYHKLITKYSELKSSSQFAIISPYADQVKLIKKQFQETFGVESKKVVDIGTVDGFQGREKDVVIFSCVRANKKGSIGFLSDFRRMNVGITRAKSSVLVIGSASTLRNDEHWNNLIESAEQRNCFFKVSKPFSSFFSDENLKAMMAKDENAATADGTGPYDDENIPLDVNAGVADPGPGDDYGDGDADMMEGGGDDD